MRESVRERERERDKCCKKSWFQKRTWSWSKVMESRCRRTIWTFLSINLMITYSFLTRWWLSTIFLWTRRRRTRTRRRRRRRRRKVKESKQKNGRCSILIILQPEGRWEMVKWEEKWKEKSCNWLTWMSNNSAEA